MAANTSPIYTLTPINTFAQITAVDNTMSGTNANVYLAFTAGSSGGFIYKLIWQPISTSGSVTTSSANGRIYLNNGGAVGTATNNVLIREIGLAATTAAQAGTTISTGIESLLNFQMAANYTIYVSVTALAANSNWNVLAIGGSY